MVATASSVRLGSIRVVRVTGKDTRGALDGLKFPRDYVCIKLEYNCLTMSVLTFPCMYLKFQKLF